MFARDDRRPGAAAGPGRNDKARLPAGRMLDVEALAAVLLGDVGGIGEARDSADYAVIYSPRVVLVKARCPRGASSPTSHRVRLVYSKLAAQARRSAKRRAAGAARRRAGAGVAGHAQCKGCFC